MLGNKSYKAFLVAAALGLAVFAVSSDARAHLPMLEGHNSTGFNDAVKIDNGDASRSIYGRIDSASDVDFLRFDIDKPMDVKLKVLVPKAEGYEDYYPSYALIGPGLPATEAALPVSLPEGSGAIVSDSPPTMDRGTYLDPATMLLFYKDTGSIDTRLETAGTYYIVVWDRDGKVGDYAVSFGAAQKWAFGDLIKAGETAQTIRNGDWGESRTQLQAKADESQRNKLAQCELMLDPNSNVTVPTLGDYGASSPVMVLTLDCS